MLERIECTWCSSQNPIELTSCSTCGAPLDVKNKVSSAGWTSAPRIKDLTEIHFSNSTCQVDGQIVPVAEISLAENDSIYYEHHVMLWKDESLRIDLLPLKGGMKRVFSGMPFIVNTSTGPGRIAFSRDTTGELVILPIHPNTEMDVREHAFLLASSSVDYSYVRIKGMVNILFGGQGMFMDRFIAEEKQGLLVLHGYGNVFQKTLQENESILLEPGAFLYKDSSVTMQVERQPLTKGLFGGTSMALVKMTGPGRVGIQSMYVHHK